MPREKIAVLGDMGNDAQMFSRAGLGIAIGNATPEIKALVQVVTLLNDEDGFAAAIDRYILDVWRKPRQRLPSPTFSQRP